MDQSGRKEAPMEVMAWQAVDFLYKDTLRIKKNKKNKENKENNENKKN